MLLSAILFWEMRMVDEGVRMTLGESQWVLPTFGLPVDPWAFLVVLGVLLGLEVSRARGIRMGLEVRDVVDGITFTVLFGFFMAHVITVVAYKPERLAEEGIWSILKVWEGFSSTGGFIGGLMGIWMFYTYIRPHPVMRMADLIAFGFPVGWLFGRMGCAVVHDHIGRPTDFAMGMEFPPTHYAAGIRHELGFYEMLWCIPVLALFLWLGKEDRPPGTFLGLFFVLYAPVRFGLDFLRNADLEYADARYFGLTPAQYGVVAMGLLGVWLLWQRDKDFKPWAMDGQPNQGERALESASA